MNDRKRIKESIESIRENKLTIYQEIGLYHLDRYIDTGNTKMLIIFFEYFFKK